MNEYSLVKKATAETMPEDLGLTKKRATSLMTSDDPNLGSKISQYIF